MMYQLKQKELPDKYSPISQLKSNSVFKLNLSNLALNKFHPLGYSSSGGKYHILILFSPTYGEEFKTGKKPTKYSGYCASFHLLNGDSIVGSIITVDPKRTVLQESYICVGKESEQEMTSFPVTDDSEGIHIYYTDKAVLIISANVNDGKFVIHDN